MGAIDFLNDINLQESDNFAVCPKCKDGVYLLKQNFNYCGYCGAPLVKECPSVNCKKLIFNPKHNNCVQCGFQYRTK